MTRLLDAYIPWFSRVQALVDQRPGEPAEVAARLDGWFSAARSAAASASCPPGHADLAAFAAAAWADERLQTCGWEHAARWHEFLLQRRHFGVIDAGEAFFRHLQELGPEHQEVREVFALALLLGLRGRHALDHGDATWRRTRDAQVAQILGTLGDDPDLLAAPHAKPADHAVSSPWRRRVRRYWSVAGVAAGLLLGLFGACVWLLHRAIGAWFPGA